MSNAERQKRYRDNKRAFKRDLYAPQSVTLDERNAPREDTLVERIFMHPSVTRVTKQPETVTLERRRG